MASSPASVNIDELPPVENLLATRAQIEKDLQLLSESFTQLKGAQANFATSIQSLESLKSSGKARTRNRPSFILYCLWYVFVEGKKALVPLTSSVYVDAELCDCDRVLVDIGTGYYIEQVCMHYLYYDYQLHLFSPWKVLKAITKEKLNTYRNNWTSCHRRFKKNDQWSKFWLNLPSKSRKPLVTRIEDEFTKNGTYYSFIINY